jgi:hypothetical protein
MVDRDATHPTPGCENNATVVTVDLASRTAIDRQAVGEAKPVARQDKADEL